MTVVGDDDQAIYAFRGAAVDNILDFEARYPGARTVVLRRNYRSLAPVLDAAYRLIRFNDPDRLEVRTGVVKRLRAERRRRDAAAGPARGLRHRLGGGGLGRRRDRPADRRRAPRRATTPSSSAPTATPTRSCAPSTWPAIPWRFSGASGLYARPEVRLLLAFLRVVADPDSSVDLYALAASEVYGLGGEDLTAIVNMARRRNRSVWAILDELERQPGILRLAPADARDGRTVWSPDLRGYAGDGPRAAGRRGALRASSATAGCWPGWSRRTRPRPRRRSRTSPASSRSSAPSRPLLADDRAIFVARHLATLIEAGDDPATAELDPDADAVAVLTVHKAKGLEFPVVFLPGLVAGRFPLVGRGEPLPLPAGLGRGEPADAGAGARRGAAAVLRRDDPRARRADPVARRRLRRCAGSPGLAVRARGARPAGSGRAYRAPGPGPRRRRSGWPRSRRSTAGAARPADGPINEPLSLSFYQIDDYLTCPLKYKYAHVLRVPLAPHHAIIYGAALHKAVQLFHHRHARGPRDDRGGARRGLRGGLDERGVRQPRPRGGAARGRPRGAPAVPRGPARARCRRSRPTSSASSASRSAATASAGAGTGSTSSRRRSGEPAPDAAPWDLADAGRRRRRHRRRSGSWAASA